jgi:hypothetical protein
LVFICWFTGNTVVICTTVSWLFTNMVSSCHDRMRVGFKSQILPSSHWNLTCSHHDIRQIAELALNNNHSLTYLSLQSMGANSERNHWVLKYDLIILLQSTNPLKWVSVACAGKNALLLNDNSAICLISWWEQVKFQWDDGKICFVIDQHA